MVFLRLLLGFLFVTIVWSHRESLDDEVVGEILQEQVHNFKGNKIQPRRKRELDLGYIEPVNDLEKDKPTNDEVASRRYRRQSGDEAVCMLTPDVEFCLGPDDAEPYLSRAHNEDNRGRREKRETETLPPDFNAVPYNDEVTMAPQFLKAAMTLPPNYPHYFHEGHLAKIPQEEVPEHEKGFKPYQEEVPEHEKGFKPYQEEVPEHEKGFKPYQEEVPEHQMGFKPYWEKPREASSDQDPEMGIPDLPKGPKALHGSGNPDAVCMLTPNTEYCVGPDDEEPYLNKGEPSRTGRVCITVHGDEKCTMDY